MNERLVEEGWLAPANPGPGRREVLALAGVAIVLLLGWGLFGTGWLQAQPSEAGPAQIRVTVADDGSVLVKGAKVRSEQRRRGDVTFIVARAEVDVDGRRSRALVEPPAGVEPESIAVRLVQPERGDDAAKVVVTIPVASLLDAPKVDPDAESLVDVTAPVDERLAEQRADRRRLLTLRDGWWWIAPLALLGAVVAPLLLWRRARTRFFSMRVPGPGTKLELAPPSSLDPVGAAVLHAGARDVDEASAFAGHVLDLVERRQLPMRRSTTTPPGLGTLIGMHHADELEDVAGPILLELVDEDGMSVVLPDTAAKVRRLSPEARRDWHQHVAARGTFERVVDRAPERRLSIIAGAAGVCALAASVLWLFADADGRRATMLLVAVTLLAFASTMGAWLRDARRWRIVTRARRTERAQWLAWRSLAANADGPASDQRNLPVLVAVDAPTSGLRATASPSAVDLAAVTTRTIAAIKTAFIDA